MLSSALFSVLRRRWTEKTLWLTRRHRDRSLASCSMFHFAVKDSPSLPAKKALRSSRSNLNRVHPCARPIPVRHPVHHSRRGDGGSRNGDGDGGKANPGSTPALQAPHPSHFSHPSSTSPAVSHQITP